MSRVTKKGAFSLTATEGATSWHTVDNAERHVAAWDLTSTYDSSVAKWSCSTTGITVVKASDSEAESPDIKILKI